MQSKRRPASPAVVATRPQDRHRLGCNICPYQSVDRMREPGLQLLAEAQWEYAARAGTHTVWPYGDRVTDLRPALGITSGNAERGTA